MGVITNMNNKFEISDDKKEILNYWAPGKTIIVEADAGTGKTTLGTLFCREFSSYYNSWEKTLYLTYSKLAKIQLKLTYRNLKKQGVLPKNASQLFDIYNFHSLWWELIKQYWGFLGIKDSPSLVSAKEQKEFIEKNLKKAEEKGIVPEYFLTRAGNLNKQRRSALFRLCEESLMVDKFDTKYLGDKYSEVENYCSLINYLKDKIITRNKNGLFWHNDTIYWVFKLIENHPEFLSWFRSVYQTLIIDEFQDIDQAQWELVKKLTPHSIIIFADRKQTIHKWRGADPARLQQYKEFCKSKYTKPEEKELTKVHRTDNIDFANNSNCNLNPVKSGKERQIMIKLKKKTGELIKKENTQNIAILCVNNDVADGIFKYYRRYTGNYPPKRINRFGIKNSPIEYCRNFLFQIFADEVSEELLKDLTHQLLPLSFGNFELEIDYNRKKDEYINMNESFIKLFDYFETDIVIGINYLEKFLHVIYGNREKINEKSVNSSLFNCFNKVSDRLSVLQNKFIQLNEKEKRDEAEKILNKYENSLLANEFQGVGVMTVHQAKGREFDYVILPWLHNNRWHKPYDFSYLKWKDNEEHRNLFHVAKTRAKKGVEIFYPENAPSPLIRNY